MIFSENTVQYFSPDQSSSNYPKMETYFKIQPDTFFDFHII